MDMSPAGTGRMVVALAVIGLMALSAYFQMEPGKYRTLTFVLLAFFGLRVVLGRLRAR
jgi:drug/metabolite transporter (DMT)-like permease